MGDRVWAKMLANISSEIGGLEAEVRVRLQVLIHAPTHTPRFTYKKLCYKKLPALIFLAPLSGLFRKFGEKWVNSLVPKWAF